MNAPGLPTVFRRLFRVLFRAFLAVVMMGALVRCPWVDDDQGGGGGDDKEPTIVFLVDRPIVFMAPSDRASLHLSRTTNSEISLTGYTILDRDDLGTGAPTTPADTTIAIVNLDEFAGTAVLRIETGPGTAPGVYQIVLELTLALDFTRQRTVTLVVLPTDTTPVAGPVQQVAAGDTHSLALLEDGSVWAWGKNDWGQLGDGTLNDRQVPVPVQGLPGPAQAVAAGGRHSLALLMDGTVWTWGANDLEQVTRDDNSPTAVVTPELGVPAPTDARYDDPFMDVVAIAAGGDFSLILQNDGVLWAVGSNERHQLGYESTKVNAVIVNLDLDTIAIAAVAAGGAHGLFLADDNSVWGWGASDRGQLGGLVSTPDQDGPIDLAFVGDVVGIGAGLEHTLLIDPDGQVGTFGANGSGQLGDGSRDTPDAQPKTPPFLLNVVQVDGGWIHSLAREADGDVQAWGNNAFGQVSDSGNMTPDTSGRTDQLVPVRLTGVPHSTDIAAGARYSLSVDDVCGKVWSWGDNGAAQLGHADVGPGGAFRATPMPVYGLGDSPPGVGCRVLLSVVTVSAGRVTVSDTATPIDDMPCALPCAVTFPAGDVVTLTATPEPGAVFLDWAGNCTGADPVVDVTMDRARSCRAQFNAPPTPAFTIAPNPAEATFGTLFDRVRFDAGASTDPDGVIVAYAWDFDDDGTFDASGVTAEVVDQAVGTYTARLRVTDDLGLTADATAMWVVSGIPTAKFSWEPATPAPGQVATFDGRGTITSQAIVSYEWDFDDDGTFDANGPVVDHAFPTAGTYTVVLHVTDTLGFEDSQIQDVTVQAAVPGGDVTLTVVPLGGGQGQTVNLEPDVFECTYDGPTSFPSPCALTVPSDTFVRLEAIAGGGSVFSHWGVGDCDAEVDGGGEAPECHVTLTADREVGVSFE